MHLDKRTVAACKDAVANRLRAVYDQRNHFSKQRGMKITPNPFGGSEKYAHNAATWFDIFSECHTHLKLAHDDLQNIESEAQETPANIADMDVLDDFIKKEFPKEIEASEGRSSAFIAISLIQRMAEGLSKSGKKTTA